MAIERYGSKTDVVVKLVLVFFVCLLSFSVGTFVGKKFSDNQHKLAEFEPSSKDRDVASVGEAHGEAEGAGEKKSDNLTDQEIAKLAEEFVSEDEGRAPAKAHGEENEKKTLNDKNSAHEENHTQAAKPAAHGEEHAAVHNEEHAAPVAAHAEVHVERKVAQATEKTTEKAPEKTAEKPAVKEKENPIATSAGAGGAAEKRPLLMAEKTATGHNPKIGEETKKEEPKKLAATEHTAPAKATMEATEAKKPIAATMPKELAASTAGKFTVQVAAYPSESEAKKRADELTAQGFSAFFLKADIKGKAWFRVNVGLFPTSKEADAYKNDLITRAKVTSALVQRISDRTAGDASH